MTRRRNNTRMNSMKPMRTGFSGMTTGTVVDTNDPRQMGRIRVLCPALGDTPEMNYDDIPWCLYVSPFGGTVEVGTRGPEAESDQTTEGPVSYGMFNIPKVGAQALVTCLDGATNTRLWLGCIHTPLMVHTMPHGIYSYQDDIDLPDGGNGLPDGPLSSQDKEIKPLYKNQTEAFTPNESDVAPPSSQDRKSFEFRTRAADFSVGGLTENTVDETPQSFLPEDQDVKFSEDDGKTSYNTQGYDLSRVEPDLNASNVTKNVNYDPQTYAWVTPGFHAISMDDRVVNCRMRMRTTSGHQIIMDDTNERIYISTAEGKTWVELDQKGNIDVYAERNLSVRAEGDINFTTDQTFRVKAKEGIHLQTDDEMRLHSHKGTSIRTETDMNIHAENTLKMSSIDTMNVYANGELHLSSNSELNMTSVESMYVGTEQFLHVISGSSLYITSGSSLETTSADNTNVSANQIHLNTAPSTEATPPTPGEFADNIQSFLTSRIPQHEPWGRMFMTKSADQQTNNVLTPEYDYNNSKVGRGSEERGEDYDRNPNWHR